MTHTYPACPVCTTRAHFLVRKDGFDEYVCPTCGLSFVYPQPAPEWLRDEVYSYESGYQANKASDLSQTPRDTYYGRIIERLSSEKPRGTLLDVGCSSGQFMFWAREKGFACTGVEINKRTADIARQNGFEVYGGFLDTALFPKQSFDVVYLGDVIEHVTDPRIFIETCASFLKPGGILIISTPNADCWWSRTTLWLYQWFGVPWSSATPPHHLSQFTLGSLDRLLGDQGFQNTGAFFARPPSLKYELGSLHLWKRYKEERTIGNYVFMLFSFGIYALVYGLNMVLRSVLTRDFRMACFYRSSVASGVQ